MINSERVNGKFQKPTKEEIMEIIIFMEKEILKYKKKVAKQNKANEAFASKPKQNQSDPSS